MAAVIPPQDHLLRGNQHFVQHRYVEALEEYVQAKVTTADRTTPIFREITGKMVQTAQEIAKQIADLDAQAIQCSTESTAESKQKALLLRNQIRDMLGQIERITQPTKIIFQPNQTGQTPEELEYKYQACLDEIQQQAKAHLLSRRATLQRRKEITLGDGGMTLSGEHTKS